MGHDVIGSAVSVMNAVAGDLEIVFGDIGMTAYEKTDHYLPPDTIDLATDADAIIAGNVIEKPNDIRYRNPLKILKKQLNLYSVYRKYFPLCQGLGVPGIDMIVMTGNPDSLLNIIEKENLDGIISEKFISRESCKKLFRKTLTIAEAKNRSRITCVHRSDMFPLSDGTFLNMFYKEFAASEFLINDMDVENFASELIMNPSSIDVIVCTDLYGATISGMAAGMVGGIYLTPMGSIGDTQGLFEPMHGPTPDTPEGMTNPTSAILSGAMALDHIGMTSKGDDIRQAVRNAYAQGKTTPDIGGTMSTKEFTDYLVMSLKATR